MRSCIGEGAFRLVFGAAGCLLYVGPIFCFDWSRVFRWSVCVEPRLIFAEGFLYVGSRRWPKLQCCG